ncbi:fumarylacetoacetate hydrolase family protein [Fulvimonas soli]|uniref:2-keto-4-pentenoate hydratase/2-oxohepta-3-ene-1,7-dioic acid hydratase in catechol pathway n=1 Tax=Fulvimonas soli TaxID=155197 RepID=A0A316IF50_9GAMM|nr:fumarylacetoacetate hydrolase family protein [Fulvimonas soli]PWK91901.1 2-keto-4-pentenoate hydratase/2-oxohepta-3-ene-1,7-dioic acid hydratase in catechol pathway [Fulvimonas soli]TNY26028.1 5-carboxymethyl-2-hydroxymuconate isomerase [Fulvimonas soli]
MRLASISVAGKATYGVVEGDVVRTAGADALARHPDLKSALAAGPDRLAGLFSGEEIPLAQVQFLPVIPNPDKILCIGINYASHIAETGRPAPPKPVVFMRCANSQVGAGQPMVRPLDSEQLDYEGELAVVIGRRGRRIAAGDAFAHVAGYACYNDGSIRDFQRHSSQFGPGKNFPGTGAFGPWLVTTDEIPDPSTLTLVTRLNGNVVQQAPVSDLVFDVPALVAYCSTFTVLEPGDVIVTGTTGGVGAFREPPLWMKHGDIVEVEISGIGILRNPVIAEG